jgi:hypothetical protein
MDVDSLKAFSSELIEQCKFACNSRHFMRLLFGFKEAFFVFEGIDFFF